MPSLLERLSIKLERFPQLDIDREAEAPLAEHGLLAVRVARGLRERDLWVKGSRHSPERASRVHKAVLKLKAKRQTPPG